MKLSLDEYIWIVNNGDIFAFVSTEEKGKYYELWKTNKDKAIVYLNILRDKYKEKYSYIEVISTDNIIEIDLEKSFITYKIIIKLKDKYYSFEYDYSPYWTPHEQYDNISDLVEVLPHTETITKYY